MANEEVLGPRKTMFVLVIVVGCFAVLWPRILSPLILGHSRDHLKPNQYDRDAGCCEVIFDTELAVLEVLNEVCSSAIGTDGKLSPYAAIECRKSVNETCGLDIAAFLKRTDNVGKTTKMLVETMKNSNGSCLKDNFGVPIWTLSTHAALNSWTLQETLKQERPPMRGVGPHPALRERGRAIPAETPTPPSRGPVPLPPHVRVRSSPLSVYFELDIKPPPIPGMRPPLGSPGGPVAAPKSSMGFVMPIYTICIIVFFVYTLSKILFKRTGSVPYDHITPDPQFRRRVFRDESRSSPEAKLVVTAISGLVAEVQQQMEASYAQSQQRQDVQDNHTRPCTNGTVLGNSTVHIVTSDYREQSKEKSPDIQNEKEPSSEPKLEAKENIPEPKESSPEPVKEQEQPTETKESIFERRKHEIEPTLESRHENEKEPSLESKEISPEPKERRNIDDLIALTENIEAGKEKDSLTKDTDDFLTRVRKEQNELQIVTTSDLDGTKQGKPSTPELLEEALKEDKDEVSEEEEAENGSVKVVGMELTAHTADGGAWPRAEPPPVTPLPPLKPPHEAEMVKSIFLETEIPQQSRVLVADFGEDRPGAPAPKHSPLVVSGKMTLSLIQDTPRDTPERELESTLDDFTTASAVTQSAAEKGHLSEEEVEEEIEVEEIEEEIEVEEEEYEDDKELRKIEPVKEEKSNEELVKQDEIKDLDERNTEETNVELENEDEEDLSNVKESKKGELKEEDLEEEELIQINNELSKKDEVKDLDESKNTEELDVQELENEDELADEVTFVVKQLLKEAKTVIEDSNEEETKKDEPKYDERKEDEPKNEDEQRLDESKNKEQPRLDEPKNEGEPKNEDESRLHEPKNEDEPKLDEPKNEDEPKIEDEPRLDEPKFEDEPNNKDEPKLEELKNEDGLNNKDESKLDEPKNQDELRLDEPKIEDESKLEEAKNENKQESEEAKPVLKNVKKHKKKRGRRTHEQNDSDE